MQRIFVKMWYAVTCKIEGTKSTRQEYDKSYFTFFTGERFLNSIQYINNIAFSKIYNDSKIVVEQRDFVLIIF